LIKNNKETPWGKAAVEKVLQSKQFLLDVGYDLCAIEDFYDVFKDSVLSNDFEKEFQTEYICDTIVCFLRLIAAAHLKKNMEMFESFVLDLYPSLEIFISSQVEPMNVEADNVQIVALVNALGAKVKIANLDSSVASDGSVNYHDFEPMEADSSFELPSIVFLFRPGHYDLLY
jgi:ubiquitin thioesterase protein OTUB1